MKTSAHSEQRTRRRILTTHSVFTGVLAIVLVALPLPCLLCRAQSPARHAAVTGNFQSLSEKANAARDAQQLDKAVALYRQALALRSSWTEGWWSLGTILYDADQYQDAAVAFRHVVQLDAKQGTARAMLGLCEFELGNDTLALADLEASLNLEMNEDQQLRQVVLFHQAVLQQRAGRFQAARTALSSLCRSNVRSPQLFEVFGMTMLLVQDRALPSPGSTQADAILHIGHGACLAAQKNFDLARNDYDYVVAHYPHLSNVHYAYGRFLLDARDSAGAIREFQRQIDEHPDDVIARLQIGATQYKVDSAAGLPYAQEAARLAPKNPVAQFQLGVLLLDVGRYQEAVAPLEAARTAFPDDSRIYWSLASAYGHTGRPQDAAHARAEFARLKAKQQPAQEALHSTPDARPDQEIGARIGDAAKP